MNRIAVFLCHCDFHRLDIAALSERLKSVHDIVHIASIRQMCMNGVGEVLSKIISDGKMDFAVFTSCTPELHRDVFGKMARDAGLSEGRWDVAAIYHPELLQHERMLDMAVMSVIEAAGRRGIAPSPRIEVEVVKKALVIGGGVSGMQAALDIADGGYEVYLIEKSSSIGGHMIQYAEVFPTLDCPQCILTPKMVEVAQHPNIKLMTYTEVESLSGGIGRFKVRLRRKTPYVDWAKCTGCGECSNVCPIEIRSEFQRGIASQKAIFKPFPQAVPNKFVIIKKGLPPCRTACPLNVNVQGYVALIAQGRFKEALAVQRRANPFPGICGRICVRKCEAECRRREVDEPISISALKRFLADWEEAHPGEKPLSLKIEKKREKVAVVGSGPAGLACARDLALEGYAVTVFEALPEPGGMLRYGIPDYRLPKNVLKREIEEAVTNLGVEIMCNTRIGTNFGLKELKEQGYSAVFLAIGAHRGLKLGIPGEDEYEGVIDACAFLRDLNLVDTVSDSSEGDDRNKMFLPMRAKVSGKVVVIGGGNVAIDAARSSLRLGASEVTIVYRRSRREMPANPWEVEEAEAEGVRIEYLASPVRVLGSDGRISGIECVRMELGEPDASGRRRPVVVKGSEFIIEADLLITAIGQRPEIEEFVAEGLKSLQGGLFAVDGLTLETNVPGVFAGGDAVTGPATAVEAIAAGRRAAESIVRFLRGEDLRKGRDIPPPMPATFDKPRDVPRQARVLAPMLPLEVRKNSFEEVILPLSEEEAITEAKRCLACGICSECLSCDEACQPKAIDHNMKDSFEEIEVGAIVVATGFDLLSPEGIGEFEVDPDIIDPIQFERILSPSGPSSGRVFRPSDGREPKEVVFIQCCGSRDPERGYPYCSRVCCMYVAKHAMLYKHAVHDGQAYVFYMDVRSDGKGYEEFVQRAVEEEGVIYLRGRVSKVFREGDKIIVWGADTLTGKKVEIAADLVVLAMAMIPSPDAKELARKLGIRTDEFGFIRVAHPKLRAVETDVEGIFVTGTAQGPKDIPESVAQASAAASKVLGILSRQMVGMRRAMDSASFAQKL